MGMAVGEKKGPSADINVTPLTPHGLDAQVPQPPKHQQPQQNNLAVVVQILDPNGQLKINATPVTWTTLGPQLENIYKTRAEKVKRLS